ncbi:MAG: hypothetical protein OQK67_02510 [Chlorobium sp.]|nr:hypothetical protein [Chlorobium sp.]
MTARLIKNIGASVRRRLLNKAREEGRGLQELMQYYAMERFLYRLSVSPYADQFCSQRCSSAQGMGGTIGKTDYGH